VKSSYLETYLDMSGVCQRLPESQD